MVNFRKNTKIEPKDNIVACLLLFLSLFSFYHYPTRQRRAIKRCQITNPNQQQVVCQRECQKWFKENIIKN